MALSHDRTQNGVDEHTLMGKRSVDKKASGRIMYITSLL